MQSERTYSVPGMTCGHCKAAVAEELARVPGVDRIDVDLDRKEVKVQGTNVEDGAVHDAIAEAGYEVVR